MPRKLPPHLWKKGVSGNPKGKPKGTHNKVTREVKEAIFTLIEKVGGEHEFMKLYKKHDWAKQMLWRSYFDLVPKREIMEGNPDQPVIIKILKFGSDGNLPPE